MVGFMEFAETTTTRAALREVLAEPSEFVTNREVNELDEYCRDFIARSPFILIASSDGAGSIDISPKGDPAGAVRVLDDTRLAGSGSRALIRSTGLTYDISRHRPT